MTDTHPVATARPKNVHGHRKNGRSSITYTSWRCMIQRCHNRNHENWEHYGGAGVRVCDRWRGEGGFERFLADVGPRPSRRATLDRVDRSIGYEPANVRWLCVRLQNVNHGNVIDARRYEGPGPDGERLSLTITEWADLLGVRPDTLRWRLRKGKGELAFTVPVRGSRRRRGRRTTPRRGALPRAA